MSFDNLGLSQKVLDAVAASGYTEPTPIQAQAIPVVMQRRDVMGIAQTGTGKTASFTLPMLSLLEKGRARARMPRTLILEPTRELAAQVEENLLRYSQNHKLNIALLIGGTSFEDQFKKLDRGADILIATPGRMIDCYERGKLLMTGVDILVIDEADRMLDMGFIPDIEKICKLVPFTRQTLFFSATMAPEIEKLANQFLQNPEIISVSKAASTSDTIEQHAVACSSTDYEKRATLRELIDNSEELKNGIIFCNRKRDVATVFRSLDRHEYSVGALHGDMDQSSRTATLKAFRDNKITLLVASDVAARGLDIPDVSHVFNFDVPVNAEDYVHRIGRTGRAGRKGTAYMMVSPREKKGFKAIEDLIEQKVEWHGEGTQFQDPKDRGRGRGNKSKAKSEAKSDNKSDNKSDAKSDAKSASSSDNRPRENANRDRPQKHKKNAHNPRHNKSGDNLPEVKHSDDEHAFGGDEHTPAFLR